MGSLPFILARPYIGILMLSWLGYMNPHRLSWGFAYHMPFSLIVAATLVVAIPFSREPKRIPMTPVTVMLIIFILWMGITTIFSINSQLAHEHLIKVIKIQIGIFFTLMLMYKRERLHLLIWVIFLSIGFFGIKGGIFTILTGGSQRVWGPPGTFIYGNNEIALAILMVVPFGYYLREMASNKWVKRFLVAAVLLMVAASLGSQSRGAFLAALAVAGFFWLKSPKKIITGTISILALVVGFFFMPQSWHERMSTIETYQQDASAMGRINAWTTAVHVAGDRLTGGGYQMWTRKVYSEYAPNPDDIHDAHSIYFEVLGEHGYIGLFLFLTMWVLTFFTASKTIRKTKNIEELRWANILSRMVQVSMIAYATGGAFLGLAYFDLPYHLMTIVVLTQLIVKKHLADIDAEKRLAT